MYRKIALTLSVIFQPLLMPSLVFALILYGVPEATKVPDELKLSVFLLVIVSTLMIPMLTILGMKYTDSIPSVHMAEKKERFIPFIIVSLFYILVTYLFYLKLNFDELIVFSLATITAAIILLTLVTFFWKVSAHLTGLSGLIAIIIVLSMKFPQSHLLYPLILAIILSGVVASCRLYLNAHRPLELVAGFCLGFLTCFAAFFYFLMI